MVLFVCIGTVRGQQSENYSKHRLIGQFLENTRVQVTEKGLLTIENHELNALLLAFDLQKIDPCAKKALQGHSGSFVYNHPFILHFKKTIPVKELAADLMGMGIFKFVEPDFVGKADGICEIAPTDTYYKSRQWGLNNTGTFNAKSVENADIDMNHAWRITTGDSTVVVAILDSGIDPDHPEFKGRIWKNDSETGQNTVDDDNNGFTDDIIGWDFAYFDNDPSDDNGHGLNVTGIIGATGNNLYGYAGVDWNCKLMTCKVLKSDGFGYYSWWASAIYYAVDNGADVINMSLGGNNPSSAMETAIAYAYKKNVPIIASMGNGDSKVTRYPAGYTLTIAVGATETDNERVSPFFWGGGSSYGEHIDLCAPGNYIYGLGLNGRLNSYWGGTSQAAPLVAGVVALIKGLSPNISIDSIETLLRYGAKDQVGRSTEDTEGWDIYHGHGVLNAYKTLLLTRAKVISACDQYTLKGTLYDSSAAIFDTINGPSCSALTATFIDIKYSPKREHQISACDSFEWIDGKVYRSSVDQAEYFIANSKGCDSAHLLTLNLQYSSSAVQQVNSCEPYTWIDGKTYTRDETSATYVVPNHVGCDSIIRLNLNMGRNSSSIQQVDACKSYTWIDGKTYSSSGTFLASVVLDHDGCDSTVWLHLKLHELDKGVTVGENKLTAVTGNATYQWLDCDAEKAPIPGENSQEFSPAESGNFAVVLKKDGCHDTSACYSITVSGIAEADQGRFEVYPNPATNALYLKGHSTQAGTIQFIDFTGRVLYEEKVAPFDGKMLFDVADLPRGLTLVSFIKGDQRYTKKILIE